MTHTRSVIGTSLSLLLVATGFCAFTGAVSAAQSSNFLLQEVGPGNAAGVMHGSTNFQMQGDVSWRQEAPLHSNSFQITTAPPAPASSAAASSTASQGGDDGNDGGHRGEGTTTTNPPPPRPASSRIRSSAATSASSAPASSAASSASTSQESSTSEDLRGAAASDPSSSSASVSSKWDCAAVLCPGPFYHPIVLVPVPSPDSAVAHVGDAIIEALTACTGAYTSPFLFALFFVLGVLVTALFLLGAKGRKHTRTAWYATFAVIAFHATITACTGTYSSPFLFALFFVLGVLVTVLFFLGAKGRTPTRIVWYAMLAIAALATFTLLYVQSAQAAVTSPQRHVYNGHLLNASGQAITTPHYIRFSEWYSRDMVPSDVSAGVINTGAATYAGYQEVHVVTPDSQGYFSVELGSGASLPDLAAMAASDLDNLFLQVEVKAAGNPDSSYELLDTNPSDAAIDRSPILSVPFAQNADLLDQREIGTGSGSIPLLGSGGLLPIAVVPGGTNRDTFVVDSDNTAASVITLQFGSALAETLKYNILTDTFIFSSDLKVEGDLVVTGLINGIDISSIAGSDDGKLRVSSGAGLTVNITGGAYRINGVVTDYTGASGVAVPASSTVQIFIGSGGLTVRTSGFPTDESFIRLAEVITSGVGVTQINDGRVVLSDDREHETEVNMHAEFPNASYQADATENTGQLSVSLDNITLRNFYLWTSSRTTLQDYDIVVRVSLPADFVRWDAAPLSVSYRTTSADAANSKVDVSVFDTNGTPVSLGGSATGLASTSWGTSALTFAGAPTWTAGQEFLVKFKLHTKDNYQSHVGSIKLKYVRLTP